MKKISFGEPSTGIVVILSLSVFSLILLVWLTILGWGTYWGITGWDSLCNTDHFHTGEIYRKASVGLTYLTLSNICGSFLLFYLSMVSAIRLKDETPSK